MNRSTDFLLIIFVSGIVFFSNLGEAKLWDRDEPRNAGCAKEMMERGNWVTPIFNDELRDAKPVLLYWFIISAYKVFGITEFAARFWSAVAALGTVGCTYFIGQRLFDRRAGVLSAIVLASSLMFGVAARAATPDSLLIFFSTAALTVFVAFAFPVSSPNPQVAESSGRFPQSYLATMGMYGLMAIAVLAKGPIGFLMPTAIIGMHLLIVTLPVWNPQEPEKGLRKLLGIGLKMVRPFHPMHFLKTCWSMRLFTATGVVLLIAGPWYFLVGQQTDGDFLRAFFLKEHWGRSTTSFENHSGGIFYYPMVMSIGFFPWSVFALPIMVSIVKHKSISPKLVFLFCWVGVQTGVFSLVQTKLPSYVTPCYPALAVLTGYFLCQWARELHFIASWIPRISFATLFVGGLGVLLGVGYAAMDLLGASPTLGLIGLLPMVTGAVAFFVWRKTASRAARERTVQWLAVSATLFSALFFGAILPQVSQQQKYDELFVQKTHDPDRLLGSFGCLEPTWVFYSGKTVFELSESNGKSFVSMSRERDWHPKPRPDLKQFLTLESGQVITLKRLLPHVEKAINGPVSIVRTSPYFMKDEELVLIESMQPDVASKERKEAHAESGLRR